MVHPNGERTFWLGFYPFEVNGVAAFNFGTGDPNEAYHQYWPLDPAAAEELSEWAGQALQEVDYVFESTEADG